MKKVTSKDVAQLAGVSQSTVSLILSNNKKSLFSDQTKERVYAAAQQLGYRLPSHGTAGSTERRKLIMILTHTLSNMYYSELTQSIEQYANECGYRVISCNTFRQSELEKYYLDLCEQIRPEGIIYTFLPNFPRMVEQLSQTMPIVLIGEKTDELAIPSIELSNIKAGGLLADHLIELGHTHFAFLSTPKNNITLSRVQRLEGIRMRLAEHGLEKNLSVYFREDDAEFDFMRLLPFEYETGYDLTLRLLKDGCKATAIIGVNDATSLGILGALHEKGHRVPEEYSVCGFDNIFPSMVSNPPLTTVDHHLNIRGQAAVDIILSRVGPRSTNGSSITQMVNKIEYESQLIVRESTARR